VIKVLGDPEKADRATRVQEIMDLDTRQPGDRRIRYRATQR